MDDSFIRQASNIEFDAIGLSFVQSSESLNWIARRLPAISVVSKIENLLGVLNANKIIEASDLTMIDRGDLFAEVGLKSFYKSILRISQIVELQSCPMIMATENLDTMQKRLQPSKSEIVALQHSIELGSKVLMLSDETATSKLYMNTISWLSEFLSNMEPQYSKEWLLDS